MTDRSTDNLQTRYLMTDRSTDNLQTRYLMTDRSTEILFMQKFISIKDYYKACTVFHRSVQGCLTLNF